MDTKIIAYKDYVDEKVDNAANTVKNDLLNGAGEDHNTLKKLGDLIVNHNHDSSDIVSGTLSSDILPTVPIAKGGTGYTTIEDTTYTTARYRASSLHSTETTPTTNGVIAWTYE